MDKGYPRRVVKYFPGIGLRVDAAFQHKGKPQRLLGYLDDFTDCERIQHENLNVSILMSFYYFEYM